MNKIECCICSTPVNQDEISNFAAYGGLPSPCCEICFTVNDYTIKSQEELAAKSLLRRAKMLTEKRE